MKRFRIFCLDHALDLLNWLLDRDFWPLWVRDCLLSIHNRMGKSWTSLCYPEFSNPWRIPTCEELGIEPIADIEWDEITWADLP